MIIDKKYSNLNELLQDNQEATAFFNELPDYVKEAIQQRPDGVNSFESMCNYADNLLAGDR